MTFCMPADHVVFGLRVCLHKIIRMAIAFELPQIETVFVKHTPQIEPFLWTTMYPGY